MKFKLLFLATVFSATAPAMARGYHDDDSDEILAISTAAYGATLAGLTLSETSEQDESRLAHKRMIEECQKYLRSAKRYGEAFAYESASEELKNRLAEEEADPANRDFTQTEIVFRVLQEEKAALDRERN